MLPVNLCSAGGHAIRFVASGELGDDNYEHRIYTSGQVSTRPQSWHDLFNALVWMRYPRIKTALNSLHYQARARAQGWQPGSVVLRGKALSSPVCLAPLPLAGVPGWWPRAAQNDGQFYMDSDVFRQPPAGLKPAPVHHLV
jgi:hypothetical protein